MQSTMFGKVVCSLCRDRSGRALVASAIGVLTGVRCLLATQKVPVSATNPASTPVGVKTAPPAPQPIAKSRIKISQTRSELGYVYWVVRQFGANPSYALFDTWREAMDEAMRRIAAAAQMEHSLVAV